MSEELVKKVLENGLSIDQVAERVEFFKKKKQPASAMIVLLYAETRFQGNPEITKIKNEYCNNMIDNVTYHGFGKYCKNHIHEFIAANPN